MARKYKRGKQIKSVGEFENSKSDFFIVLYGPKEKTTHRGWMISWQYHFMYWTIKQGRVYEANLIDQCKGCIFNVDSPIGCAVSELAYFTMDMDGKCIQRVVKYGKD